MALQGPKKSTLRLTIARKARRHVNSHNSSYLCSASIDQLGDIFRPAESGPSTLEEVTAVGKLIWVSSFFRRTTVLNKSHCPSTRSAGAARNMARSDEKERTSISKKKSRSAWTRLELVRPSLPWSPRLRSTLINLWAFLQKIW